MAFAGVRIIQAPMAGVSTPMLAAAVASAGGLGSIALGALSPDAAAAEIAATRAMTSAGLALNLFCHAPARRDPARESGWAQELAPHFRRFGAVPPTRLGEPYTSFRLGDAMLAVVLAARPAAVSFHFGLPRADQIAAIREMGALMMATATSEAEAAAAIRAGMDGIVAQGWQAGGHRGCFDPDAPDDRLETLPLLRRLTRQGVTVIAAGGIMTAADVAAAMAAGAAAVQCGTAFLRTPEAATSPAHRAALTSGQTMMTRAVSGRPARGIRNLWADIDPSGAPDYPVAYDAGKALNAAGQAAGETGFGAFWAGTGAANAEARPAAEIVAALNR